MIGPDYPDNESERQRAVERYHILDTLPETQYDNITALMAHIADTPVSLITMLDHQRNFLKSHHGVPFSESPRNISFCGHAILSDQPITVVEDASVDPRFCSNPLVTDHGIRFYAGVPLCTPDNFRLGTLCIFDIVPRTLAPATQVALTTLAAQVEALLQQRITNFELTRLQQILEKKNEQLLLFGQALSHDLKSPLINIAYSADALLSTHPQTLSDTATDSLKAILATATTTCRYADSLLNFYSSDALLEVDAEEIFLDNLLDELDMISCQSSAKPVILTSDSNLETLVTRRAAFLQILVNLATNAIKYNDKSSVSLTFTATEDDTHYYFSLTDNSCGIPTDKIDHIFDRHTRIRPTDSNADGNGTISGYGLGLCTVKKLVNELQGTISASSTEGVGSTFSFSIQKTTPASRVARSAVAA